MIFREGRRRVSSLAPLGALLLSLSVSGCAAMIFAKYKKLEVVNAGASEPQVRAELVLQSGHETRVTALAFDRSGTVLASGGKDQTIRIWDGREGNLLRTVRTWSPVVSLAVSPDGSLVAAATAAGALGLWRTVDGAQLRTHRSVPTKDGPAHAFTDVRFTPDGQSYVASAGFAGLIRFRVSDGDDAQVMGGFPEEMFGAADLSADGSTLIGCYLPASCSTWDPKRGEKRTSLHPPQPTGGEVAYAADVPIVANVAPARVVLGPTGQWAVTFSDYALPRLWPVADPTQATALVGHRGQVLSAHFAPSGELLATGGADGTIILWRPSDGSLLRQFIAAVKDPITTVAFGSRSDVIALGTESGRVSIRRVSDGAELASMARAPIRRASRLDHGDLPGDYRSSADGRSILWSGRDGSVKRELEGAAPGAPTPAWLDGHPHSKAAVSPNGRYAALATEDHLVALRDGVNGTLLRPLGGLTNAVAALTFNADGSVLVAIGEDGRERGWSIPDGAVLPSLDSHEPIRATAFSPDGTQLATGDSAGGVVLWDARTGAKRVELPRSPGAVRALLFSLDGRQLLSSAEDGAIRIWTLADRRAKTLLHFEDGGFDVFDDQGRFDCGGIGCNAVHFVRGMQMFSSRQLWDHDFTPGLLGSPDHGPANPQALEAILAATPKIELELVQHDQAGGTGTFAVRTSAGSNGVGEPFLFLNGRPLQGNERGVSLVRGPEGARFTLQLVPGENRVVAAAFDRSGRAQGRSPAVQVRQSESAAPPDMYIVAIGVGAYRDPNIRLESPAQDAQALAAELGRVAGALYGSVHLEVLTNEQATAASIRQRLADVAAKIQPRDALILFFAGHGEMVKGDYRFLPYETDIASLDRSTLSAQGIGALIKDVPASKIALFFDTCKSGAAAKALGALAMSRNVGETRVFAELSKNRGIAVFAAANDSQAAYELRHLRHGIFTHAMLTTLANRQALVKDRLLSISRLLGEVNRETRQLAFTELGVDQSPVMYLFGDDFPVGR